MIIPVSITCPRCKEEHVFKITEQQLAELKKGEKFIQDILPDFPPADREMFLSGYCPKCWDEILAEPI